MTIYLVYEPIVQDEAKRIEQTEFIPQRFIWSAFLFPLLYSIYHRMWWVALGVLVIYIGVSFLSVDLLWLQLMFHILFGLEADRLREWSLKRGEYIPIGLVSASSREEGERLFFSWRQRDHLSCGTSLHLATLPNSG